MSIIDTLILCEFEKLGKNASYHFADDTGTEWSVGYELKKQAMKLYDDNPTLQKDMRNVAKNFLWVLDR